MTDWTKFTPIEEDEPEIDWAAFQPIDEAPKGPAQPTGRGFSSRPKEQSRELLMGDPTKADPVGDTLRQRGGPVSQEYADQVNQEYASADPAKRQQMRDAPGMAGRVARAQAAPIDSGEAYFGAPAKGALQVKEEKRRKAVTEEIAAGTRSVGDVVGDTLAQLGKGGNSIMSLPVSLLAPGGRAYNWLKQNRAALEDFESDEMRARRELYAEQVAQSPDELSKFVTSLREAVENPSVAFSVAVEQLPIMGAIVGTGGLGSLAARGAAGLASQVSPAAALVTALRGSQAIGRAGAAGGMALGGAVAAGGDAAQGTFDRLMDREATPESVLLKNPDYAAMLASGMKPEDARKEIAASKSRLAAVIAAPLGILSGSTGLERVLSGARGGAVRAGAAELGGEIAEELGTQGASNLAVKTVDPSQRLTEGFGQIAAETLLGAAPSTAAAATLGRPVEASQRSDPPFSPAAAVESTFGAAPRPIRVDEQPTEIMPAEQVAQMAQQRQAAMAQAKAAREVATTGVGLADPGAAPAAAQQAPGPEAPATAPSTPEQTAIADRFDALLGDAGKLISPESAPQVPQQPAAPTFKTRGEALVYVTENRIKGSPVQAPGGEWIVQPKGQAQEAVAKLGEIDQYTPQQRARDELAVSTFNTGVKARNSQNPAVKESTAKLDTDPSPVFRAVRGVAQQVFGLQVVSVEGIKGGDGMAFTVGKQPVAFVRKGAKPDEITVAVAGHEAYHSLARERPDLAKRYQGQLQSLLREGVVESRRSYEGQEDTPDGRAFAEEEVSADVSGSMWLREEFWRKVMEIDTDLFRSLRYRFMANMAKMLDALGASKAFAKSRSAAGKDRYNLERLVTDVAAARDITAQLWAERAMGKKLTKGEQKIDREIDAALERLPTKPEPTVGSGADGGPAAPIEEPKLDTKPDEVEPRQSRDSDKDEWNPVTYDVVEKIDMDSAGLEIKDKDELADELDEALGQRRTPRPGSTVMEASPSAIRSAGLMMESVYPRIDYKEDGSGKIARVTADGREYAFKVSPFGFDGAWTALPDQPRGEFGEALRLNNVSEEMAEAYNQRAAASISLHAEGYDLLRQIDRKQAARLLKTWRELAKTKGAFEFDGEVPATQFKPGRFTGASFVARAQQIADSLLEGSKYQFNLEPQGDNMMGFVVRDDPNQEAAIELDDDGRKPRLILHAIALNRGSGAGKAFYQVAAQIAKEYGADIVADPQGLTAVNTYRRTEQMLSAALRSGDASVIQPGYGQRIYGWEPGKTKAAKESNLIRLALASARNAKEAVPFADRLRYNLETGEFTADGLSAEGEVEAALRNKDARAMSISRSTLARAAITFEALEGEVEIPGSIRSPVLYSRDEESYTPLEALSPDNYKAAEGREVELDDGESTVRIDAAILLRDLRDRMSQARQLMDCLA